MTPRRCLRCANPAALAGLCYACIRAERARRRPIVATAMDALHQLGWTALASRLWKLESCFDVDEERGALPFEEVGT